MAFDMGFNFRGTAIYVTDPAYGVPVLGEVYPHTYTNGNGQSVNGGFDVVPATYDFSASNDPRIAGCNYSSTTRLFTVDLSSGSAPGAGNYLVDLAENINGQAHTIEVQLKDSSTVLVSVSGLAIAADHYVDATGADVGPCTTTWTGTRPTYAYLTTTATVLQNASALDFIGIAHFRLTKQAAATTTPTLPSSLMLLGVGM